MKEFDYAAIIDRESFMADMTEVIKKNDHISDSFYSQYDVKRGLRNSNGTGVLVGLTQIGDVQGYEVVNDKKMPIPGKLYYRGVDIEDIISACTKERRFGYEETSYLLLFGDLPSQEQLSRYKKILGDRRELPQGFTKDMILTAASNNIMNKVARSVLALYSYDDNPDDISIKNVLRQSVELIARFPAIVAYGYQAKQSFYNNGSLHIHYPLPELSTAENVLRLIRPTGEYSEIEATLLDICLILHAEHGGGNNSAFATHVISSSGTDTYSAISAAVGSLKGPKHGGANVEVLRMIKDLKEHVRDITNHKEVEEYLKKILRGEAGDGTGLIYGLGHAVYTISDPRATLLKKMAKRLAEAKGILDEFMIYDLIERRASALYAEVKGVEKYMVANVDLYSGFVYSALNIPEDLATPLFAISRISGWCAHRMEELVAGGKIMRPAYQGVEYKSTYVPLLERK